jgi:serine/threonine protein phosphatase PrpC
MVSINHNESDTTGATGGTISQPKINKIIKCFGSIQQLVLMVRFRTMNPWSIIILVSSNP